jgi:hypothetical protein
VIGTANEKDQQTVGTVTYADGSTDAFPIAFGDWAGSVGAPKFGNTLVATSDHRTVGVNGRDTLKAGVFATAVFPVPAGKQAVSLTLPKQEGSPTGTGRIHVFAIATNGTRVATTPLAATAGATLTGTAGKEVTGTLATATGGHVGTGTTATVNWGDGTPLEDATVTVTDGTATVTGKHTYADAGARTAVVTVDDGTGSAAVRTPVEIAAAPVWHTALTTSAGAGVQPGGPVHVSGTGFEPGEQVAVSLDGAALPATVTADATGAVAFDVTAPATTGTHAVSALGAQSQTVASVSFATATAAGTATGAATAAAPGTAPGRPSSTCSRPPAPRAPWSATPAPGSPPASGSR